MIGKVEKICVEKSVIRIDDLFIVTVLLSIDDAIIQVMQKTFRCIMEI